MNNDRVSETEHYLAEYQKALRGFRAGLAEDRAFEPYSIAASIGRVEVHPCTDSAVVLTYHDDSNEIRIEVKERVELSATRFTNESELFRYFDRNGDSVSVRLTYNEDVPDATGVSTGFLRKKHANADVIAWAEDLSTMTAKGYEVDEFFRPQFKRVSILGWQSFLGDPHGDAAQFVREAFAFRNLLGFLGSQAPGKNSAILKKSKRLISAFEVLLDSDKPLDAVKSFLNEHPDLLQLGYSRRYADPSIGERQVGDFLVTHWDGQWKSVCALIGEPKIASLGPELDPLKSLESLKLEINETRDYLDSHEQESSHSFPTGGAIEYLVVAGRSSGLSYGEQKEFRDTHFATDCTFMTYDNLISRFKAGIRELTEAWLEFESVDDRLQKLGISDSREFHETMQAIDADMERDGVPIPARPLKGWLRFSSIFGLYLMNRDPLSERILKWFDDKFGDQLKIDPTWKFPVLTRDRVWQMRIPLIFGTAQFICSPDRLGTAETTAATKEEPPVVNVLDLIDGFSKEQVEMLDPQAYSHIFSQFQLGLSVRTTLERLSENTLVVEAMEQLENCTRLTLGTPPDIEKLEQEALTAIRRLLEAFILERGVAVKAAQDMDQLVELALSAGLRSGTGEKAKSIGNTSIQSISGEWESIVAIVRFVQSAYSVCSEIANEIFLARNFTPVTELRPGEFYTNRLGKTYRCINVDGDLAEILLLDEVMGNTLDVLFTQKKDYWDEYYRIDHEPSLAVLRRRYEAWTDGTEREKAEQKPKDD